MNTKPENAISTTANETHETSLPLYLPLMQTSKQPVSDIQNAARAINSDSEPTVTKPSNRWRSPAHVDMMITSSAMGRRDRHG